MAWMKDEATDALTLTKEFTVWKSPANPTNVSKVLGLNAEVVSSTAVADEVARVEGNRARLITQVADATLARVKPLLVSAESPDVDVQVLATLLAPAVAAALAPMIADLVADEFAKRLAS